MDLKRGDVVLVAGLGDVGKPRPAVIVQSDELGDDTSSIVICPLSSQDPGTTHIRPIIGPDAGNGLRQPSQIMTESIGALRRDKVRAVVGHLDDAAMERLDRALLIVLGLAGSA